MDTAKLRRRERKEKRERDMQASICNIYKNIHLLPEESRARDPAVLKEEVDSCIEEEHRQRIVKETKDKDGVNPVCSAAKKHQHKRRIALRLEDKMSTQSRGKLILIFMLLPC